MKDNYLIFVLTSFCSLTIFYYEYFTTPLIVIKDLSILIGIESINSFSEYINAIKTGTLLDIQPIRDITFFFDLYMKRNFEYFQERISNVIIWFLISLEFFKFSKKFFKDKLIHFLFSFSFTFHPLVIQITAWPIARKHLLAFYFILLTLKYFQDNKSLKSVIAFILSLLSHPLYLLVPVVLLIVDFLKVQTAPTFYLKRYFKKFIPLFIVSLIIGLANIYYYDEIFTKALGNFKYSRENSIADRILSLFRYFSQILYPFVYSSFYDKGSLLNIIGVPIGVIFSFVSFKYLGVVTTIKYVGLFVAALFPTIINMTNIFVSDTYALLPLFSVFIIIASIIAKSQKTYNKVVVVCILLSLNTLFVYRSYKEITPFFSEEVNFWKNAYEKEKACPNLYYYSYFLLLSYKTQDLGLKIANDVFRRKCIWFSKNTYINFLAYQTRYLVLSNHDKYKNVERIINTYLDKGLYFKLALAVLQIKDKRIEEGLKTLKEVNQHNTAITEKEDGIVKFMIDYCKTNDDTTCKQFLYLIKEEAQ